MLPVASTMRSVIGGLLRGILVLMPLVASSSPAAAQRSTLERILRDTVLANGLHVIVLENNTVPIATVQVVVKTGAFTQLEPADEGVPHLLEHMLFRAFGGGGESGGFGRAAAELNASYNGTTSDESVTYYLSLPSSNAARGIRLMAELMRTPRFRSFDLQAEQRVVRGELERAVADPMYLLGAGLNRALWGPAFGRKQAIGNALSIDGADADRLRRHYEHYYVPNNAALIVAGDASSEMVFEQAARHFASWRRGDDPFAARPIPRMPSLDRDTSFFLTDPELRDVTVMFRWHGPSVRRDPAATYAADVFSALVNQPLSGFQRRLVESGHFATASISYSTLDHVGPITLVARTTPERLVPAVAALEAEIVRFGHPDYFTEEELRIATKRQTVETALDLERGPLLAHAIGYWWSVAGLDYYVGYADEMSTQTSDDLRRYVTRYILGAPKAIGVMMSEEAAEQLRGSVRP